MSPSLCYLHLHSHLNYDLNIRLESPIPVLISFLLKLSNKVVGFDICIDGMVIERYTRYLRPYLQGRL